MTKKAEVKKQEEPKQIDFAAIEKKWQKKWEDAKCFEVKENPKKKKYYALEMFPYPSASGLHMGHALNYTIGDIFARFKRMSGFNVLYPMGYDAFGLPAENAAIKANSHPKPFTEKAMTNYMRQMKEIGLSYDWSRMVRTCEPEYYKWNQFFFLKMFEKGLVYRKKAAVNWCSKCETVLANEQVHNGKCWRHDDTDVEIKQLEQWFIKTTAYAEELLDKVKTLHWPERIKTMQENWIGRSEGTEILFEIQNPDRALSDSKSKISNVNKEKWPIFTTRPDTLFGVTFMVVSAHHPKLMELVTKEQKKEVESFLKRLRSVSEKELEEMEKDGVFTGSYAINPMTKDKVPVYAGNFVVADYGSGMVMAVPAHDQRDFEFAKKYKIPVKVVIQEEGEKLDGKKMDEAYTSSGILVNSGPFNDLDSVEAKTHITKALEEKKLGKSVINYKLRDWLVSRQRYWGTPIPMIYCEKCGVIPVPEKELPVILPEKVKFGEGNPLATNKEFVEAKCPKCKGKARRETDTMDTFFDSSWYYLRYCDSKNSKMPFDKSKAEYWMPVDFYVGGAEHACMHLIYARFFTKALRDMGLVKFDEPFTRLFNQGMLHGSDGEKMSKSKGNVVLPEEVSAKYGMDTARLFLVSQASPDKDTQWSDAGIEGSLRFIKKLFDYISNAKIGASSKKVEHKINHTIKMVGSEIEDLRYNIAVIRIRELFDTIEKEEISRKDLESVIKLISPFCPHIAEELWEKIKAKGFISLSEWPKFDESKIDIKFEEAEKAGERTIEDILNVLKIIKEKQGKDGKKVYLYVIPNELSNYNADEISKRISKEVFVFAVNDKKKHDPEGKSSKAKPGKPGIYVE